MTAPSTAAPLATETVIATLQRIVDQVRYVSALLRNLLYRVYVSNTWKSVQVGLGFLFPMHLDLIQFLLYVMIMLLVPFWIHFFSPLWIAVASCRLKEPLQSSMLPKVTLNWIVSASEKEQKRSFLGCSVHPCCLDGKGEVPKWHWWDFPSGLGVMGSKK